MNNLTTEQIARVFAMYYPCDVVVDANRLHGIQKHLQESYKQVPAVFDSINRNTSIDQFIGVTYKGEDGLMFQDCFNKNVRVWQDFCKSESVKLLLRPLSAITDEDAIEVAQFHGYDLDETAVDKKWDRESVAETGREIANGHPHDPIIWNAYQFLTQRGYAIPLFIAPNHPDNGKTAIELGLALDATINNKK